MKGMKGMRAMKPAKAMCGLFALLLLVFLAGCSAYSERRAEEKFSVGAPITPEEVGAILRSAATEPETEKYPAQTDAEGMQVYYWTKSGEVIHVHPSCPSLSRSKNVISGHLEDAVEAGKERFCSVCGGK